MSLPILPIREVAQKLALPESYYEPIGTYGAKVKLELLKDRKFSPRGKLILVTATTPTVSGEGKTVVSIGLAQGLTYIGKQAILTSREPSLGPVFGVKGGAAGGGRSQVEPSQKINLHFHGDFHAISSAHNLLAAMIDAHLFHGNALDLDPEQITWPRTVDMNDRALRNITIEVAGKREGANRSSGFVITAASEVMAIVALAENLEDLRLRLGRIVIGTNRKGEPVCAEDLGAIGAMMALLAEAILPNLVQTTEGTPALVHAGPFGNIAHGTSSILSHNMGLRLADYVVNEAGFASDLGAEKYLDIVMRASGIAPAAAVLVTTVRSLEEQGSGDLVRGFANLDRHIAILHRFGVPVIVAINRFPGDEEEKLALMAAHCAQSGVESAPVEAFSRGGAGSAELARKVVATIEANPGPPAKPVYELSAGFEEKICLVASQIYGAAGVTFSDLAKRKLVQFTEWGYGNLPICIAKTQYSLSDDPKLLGAPKGWQLRVTDASLSAGAGFVVVIAGNMMLMPGLPKAPRALDINVDAAGQIFGM
jgi:formate--tetrahydrofolate ligase